MSTIEAPSVAPAVTRRDVLHRAADLLEEFGWWQFGYGSKQAGKFCALGAVDEALRDLGCEAMSSSFASMPLYESLNGGSVVDWNDAPYRTRAEVVARLREAAEAES